MLFFISRICLNVKRVNIGLHEFTQCLVNAAMPGQPGQAVKQIADDPDAEVTASVARPRMTDVKMRIINHFKLVRPDRLAQARFNHGHPLDGHGSTRLKGRTSAPVQAPHWI